MHFEKVSFEEYKKSRVEVQERTFPEEEIREEYNSIKLPERATIDSAGYDFFMPYSLYVSSTPKTIPTGIRFVCDDRKDVFLMCVPRSGLGFKYGFKLTNTTGIIDSGYYQSDNEGHIKAKFSTAQDLYADLPQGKAFMQGIILPYLKVDDDNATAIRNGGFGSTDKK